MTTQRISSPGKEDRITNMKSVEIGTAFAAQGEGVYSNVVKEANGYLFWMGEDFIVVSRDGVSFVDTGYVGSGEKLYDVAYGNDKYVVVGEGGLILYSIGPDEHGQWNWGIADPPDEFTGTYLCATFTEGAFLIGGGTDEDVALSDPVIHRSANGVLWLACTITLDTSTKAVVMDLEPGNGNILAVGSGYTGAVTQRFAALSTAPDEDFEEDAVTLPALPEGAEDDVLFRALFTGSIFLISGVYEKEISETDYTFPLLYQSGTGAELEDITDRLSVEKDFYPPFPSFLIPPSWPNMMKHGSDFFYMHYGAALEIARLGEDGPENFREIPIEKFSYKNMTSFGDNFYFVSPFFLTRSDPFIPIPPAPVV